MLTKPEVHRFLKAVVLGAPLALVLVLSTLFMILAVAGIADRGALPIFGALIAYVSSVMGLLWVTGFWGRWTLAVFFGLAPLLVIVDFAVDPFFPLASVLLGVAALGVSRGVSRDA